ncbi:tannase/feruloyl esterase family alpha/beta hydrolase [Phenylobacterium sp.]|uniref:tannase/feruloyl esterase family alpha/beta hydrolase n=1 Tax=Phenylobacterium sp. TaxID=1871053 RepID=UPI002DEF27A1|nr:tannase/feruloyl esterase family alpha/beta hydrolase [Phenylobacterium sp.]
MVLAAALMAQALAAAAANDCATLTGRELAGGSRVVSAERIAVTGTAAVCRTVLESSAGRGSRIETELWLPLTGWSGRFVQLGTGGFAGTIPTEGLAAEVRRGNAVAVTDAGHRGRDGFDAAWARGHPEAVLDYGFRAVPIAAAAAKAATAAFYGAAPRHSYFVGCSNGGRQALMAAQRNPETWDGVLAGSPALRWSEQLSRFGEIQRALRGAPAAMIPRDKLPAIQAAARSGALRADRLGLNRAQAQAVRLILRDFDARWAAAPGGWDQWIVNPDRNAPSQLTFAEQFFGAMVDDRPDWRVEDLTERDLEHARRLAPVLDATNPDLSAFRRRGGKLIIYAGAADPVISPKTVIGYFESLPVRDNVRLFVIPGMLHCQGGPEPNAFGQAPVAPALAEDPDHDVRRALEAWVEHGRAPEHLVTAKYTRDDPRQGVAATQVVRAYRAGGPEGERR